MDMTREEAIEILEDLDGYFSDNQGRDYDKAFRMAIETLSEDIVRCKDCIQKHIGGSVTHYYWCDLWDMEVDCNNYCSWAERREP